jgi:ankyrin repeat protein
MRSVGGKNVIIRAIREFCQEGLSLQSRPSFPFRVSIALLILAFPCSAQSPQAQNADALIYAIQSRDLDQIKKILDSGADLNAAGRYGETPLAEAIALNLPALAIEIIYRGADVNLPSIGWSPLMTAASSCDKDVVLALLERGAIVNYKDRDGGTAIENASDRCKGGRIVKILLKAGANPNSADTFGNTPLMTAAGSGNELAVNELIAAGADVNAKNNDGETALFVARHYPFRKKVHERIYAMLLKASGQ